MQPCLPATDWNAISAMAASAAAVAAIVWQLSELRHRKAVRQTELMIRLDEKFDSLEFRKIRVRAAQYLLNPRETDSEGEDAVYTVLNFFEGIAYHWRSHLINDESVWFFVGYWLLPYYIIANTQIVTARAHDPDAFVFLDPMVESVRTFKSKRRREPTRYDVLTTERSKDFLKDEAALFCES